jgi:uncharacterized iron-regulated membrane protein
MIKTSNNNLSDRPAPKPKHWLLAKSRQWHLWGGLIAAIFLLIVGATGIVLNYKKPIFTALGIERDGKEMKDMKPAGGDYAKSEQRDKSAGKLTTTTGFAAATVSVDQALTLARENLGDVALERIELKNEHGTLLYKIKSRSGEELQINAATGAHYLKGEYEKVKASPDGAVMARTTDWGKIMIDLHTGKIGGEVGKALMTIAAVILLLLTLSGVYMWLKPVLIRRENAKAKARAAQGNVGATSAAVPAAARTAKPELAEA